MELIFEVNKPIEYVFDQLTDMDKFAKAHPVINKIEYQKINHFKVYEAFKIGFFKFSFTYPVHIKSDFVDKTIVMKATIMKLTHVEMKFKLNVEDHKTIISEKITFKSILPIKSIMKRVFKKQHTILFENIDALKYDFR